jgi:hypothetical protein
VTGVSLIGSTLEAKRLEMLHRLLPSATSIGALVNPNYPDTQFELSTLQKGAEAIGLKINVANASREEDLAAAFVRFSDTHVGALLVATDVLYPASLRPFANASTADADSSANLLLRKPMTGCACCARIGMGHATAPPRVPRNSRRLMYSPLLVK